MLGPFSFCLVPLENGVKNLLSFSEEVSKISGSLIPKIESIMYTYIFLPTNSTEGRIKAVEFVIWDILKLDAVFFIGNKLSW